MSYTDLRGFGGSRSPAARAARWTPRIPPDRKERRDHTSSRCIVNACKPYDWINEFPPTNVASPELRKATLAKWRDLLG